MWFLPCNWEFPYILLLTFFFFLSKYMSVHYMPGAILGLGDTTVNQTGENLSPYEFKFQRGMKDN